MSINTIKNNEIKKVKQIRTQNGGYINEIYARINNSYERVFIGAREISGKTPLTYKSLFKTNERLEDYLIYGNTVNGESVGDKTGNLFDKSGSQYGNNLHWLPTGSLVYSDTYYGSPIMDVTGLNTITRSYTGTGANYFLTSDLSQFVNVSNTGTVDAGVTINVPDGYTKYVFNIPNTIRPDSIMVNSGSTPLPYEPYGYKIPVTVREESGGTITTNIYLDEPLAEGESISMSDTGIAIPTISGTNILSVDTQVQPSMVYVKGKIKKST